MVDPFLPRQKMRRKKRKGEGDDIFTMLTKEQFQLNLGKDKGLRCRECGKWKAWPKIYATYEKRSGDLIRVWWCPDCNNMLREDNITGYELHLEWQEREEGPIGKRILICGDRNWTDVKAISKILKGFDPHTTILICGMARGADRIAYDLARRMGMRIMEFPANWDEHGRSAGPIRNREMLKAKPELVIAFHDDLENSKGTKDMVKISVKAGIRVRKVRHKTC